MNDYSPDDETISLLSRLERLDLNQYRVVGEYLRFDDSVRNSLKDFKLKLTSSLGCENARRECFLIWGKSGSGKTFFIQQIVKELGTTIKYIELNLATLNHEEFKRSLEEVENSTEPTLCFVDEIDSKPKEDWPYDLLIFYTEPSKSTTHNICYVYAGSGGDSLADLKGIISKYHKGIDLLSRVFSQNELTILPFNTGDRLIVAASQMLVSAYHYGKIVREIERLALFYIMVTPSLGNGRQLRILSESCAERIPLSEDRIKYDFLFASGDMESKKFLFSYPSYLYEKLANIFLPVPRLSELEPLNINGNKRIMILPFTGLSLDPKDKFIDEGFTVELTERFMQIKGTEIISFPTAKQCQEKGMSISEIRRVIGVGAVIDGEVEKKIENRIIITVRLNDADRDTIMWSEHFDAELDEMLGIERNITERVADSLKLNLTSSYWERMKGRETTNAKAHELYLRGMFYSQRVDKDSIMSAIKLYEEALSIDPNYAPVYARLAYEYRWLARGYYIDQREARTKEMTYIQKALEIQPLLPEGRTSNAVLMLDDYNSRGAEIEAKAALEVDPNYVRAYIFLILALAHQGRERREIHKLIEKMLSLDPLSVQTEGTAGTRYLYLGENDMAIKHLKNVVDMDPENFLYLGNLGVAYIRKGLTEEGLPMVAKAAEKLGIQGYMNLAYAYASTGQVEKVSTLLAELLISKENEEKYPLVISAICAILGKKEDSINWLEKAYSKRDPYLNYISENFVWDSVRDDPRFEELLGKLGISYVK